ncbi:hypothetical protein [Paenibacillus naphthalenovorans]|uniref:hypothetical protein n=1 Tax=Paenibacillus naphthalenovorans TaxID=162209 RepID=UPI003D2BA9B0
MKANLMCCGKMMKFNDNSITNNVARGQIYPDCSPIYCCDCCNAYYDGFTAHEPIMLKFTEEQVKQIGCESWFHPDVMERLENMRELTRGGVNGAEAYQKVFLGTEAEIPVYYHDGNAVYRIFKGGRKYKSKFASYDEIYLVLPEFSYSIFDVEEITFLKEMIVRGRAKEFYGETDVKVRLDYGLLSQREYEAFLAIK